MNYLQTMRSVPDVDKLACSAPVDNTQGYQLKGPTLIAILRF